MTAGTFRIRPRDRNALAVLVPGLFVGLWLTIPLAAQPKPKPTDYQVKAAYLSDFGRFVEWSSRAKPSPEESFDLCVLGPDPFGPALDAAIAGERIGGAALTARRIARPQEALGCRILFIASPETNQLEAILTTLGTASVLTVGDMPDFVKRGGMIQFVLDGNRVRFEINIPASRHAGLNLSSELLKLARAVRRAP